jgi:hypothetical protein
MKNASCHDDKMEAYCKAVRALEDKFYGIELNHVPRRYNEEADELAKIASGWITVPPNVFSRDIAQPSVTLEPHPSNHTEPSGAPSNPAGAEPMDEDCWGDSKSSLRIPKKIKSGNAKDAGSKTPRSSRFHFHPPGTAFYQAPFAATKVISTNPT